ncbi:MAG TPA: catalase family peroxidase [Gemmatimonadales bacterium]|jgi:catalase
MPLLLLRLVSGAALIGAIAVLVGCNRPRAQPEQSSQSAAPAEGTATPVASLPQQIADVMVQLNGGIHTGFRFAHAKGIVCSGTFTPTALAKTLSRAAHFSGPPVPVTVRFSDGTGVPNISDNNPRAGPRGMSIRFTLPGGGFTDIVSNSHNGFVVGTGEDFLAFLKAVAASGPTVPHPTPIEGFLGSHPRAAKFATESQALPKSFATLAYFGNNALVFVDGSGKKQAVRYQIVPVAGLANLDSASAAKAGENYLLDDLQRRLQRGPVQFQLYVQLANPGDPTSDGSVVWPPDRKRMLLGTIRVKKVEPNQEELQRSLTFNPTFLTSGIELSDDPLLVLRSAVYALSVAHRH